MPRLSALLSAVELAALDSGALGATTVEEWLLHKCTSSPDEALGQDTAVEQRLLDLVAPRPCSGLELLDRLRDELRALPTGCTAVDDVLPGGAGIREGCVVEVAGASSSGKTQLCHSMAALTAARREGVIYIDTTNAFSAARVWQLAPAMAQGGPPDPSALLSCITVCRPHSVHELLAVLDELAAQLDAVPLHHASGHSPLGGATQVNSTARGTAAPGSSDVGRAQDGGSMGEQSDSGVRGLHSSGSAQPACTQRLLPPSVRSTVLIIDSVSAVISPVLGQRSGGFVLMSGVGRALKALAARHNLAVLVTNHVTAARSAGQDGVAPAGPRGHVAALGDTWRGQPHARVQLTAPDDPREPRVATLTHCNSQSVGSSAAFAITNVDLRKVAMRAHVA